MGYPRTICNLIESFKKLPGVGEKTAERMALSILELDTDVVEFFSKNLLDSKLKIQNCLICGNLSEESECEICKDKTRDNKVLCVVEEPKNIITFEKVGVFNGKYHVLGGLISPLDGITPEDINISKLIDRITKENINEIIIAVKPSIEGETTALYITRMLKDLNVTVTKIAHGVPIGADMEYLDSLTLELAFDNRMKISE